MSLDYTIIVCDNIVIYVIISGYVVSIVSAFAVQRSTDRILSLLAQCKPPGCEPFSFIPRPPLAPRGRRTRLPCTLRLKHGIEFASRSCGRFLSPNCEKFRDEGLKCLICGDPRSQFAAIEGSMTMRLMCRTKSQGLANRVGPTKNRTVFFTPDGPGFARLTVMDAKGAADSVVVRLQ